MKKHILALAVIVVFGCESDSILDSANRASNFANLNSNGLYAGGDYSETYPGDRYNDFEENPFIQVADAPISTFSIDADGGSYANVRRFLNENQMPPPGAIRTEEFINYFPLNYEGIDDGHPISLNGEVSGCPWEPSHQLIRIGMKGRSIPRDQLPPSNIVLLIDVSGSMSSSDKLALLKDGFILMAQGLQEEDRISIVTYAGAAGVTLPSTPGSEKTQIVGAIEALGSGGSTAGAQGIITAYAIAEENFIEGGNNRVILGTDGDFNVGVSSQEELIALIETKRDKGIFLTVVGVGRGNYNEGMLEQVANHGNGTYEYLDDLQQAKKVFVDEYHKFYPAAKDVKVQVEFNPLLVESYRLIGYENRMLEDEDFEDDTKDAGEISIGQNVTALYEIKPAASGAAFRMYPMFSIQFRYKRPDSDISTPLSLQIFDEGKTFFEASEHMRFTASVAGFAMLLRDSQFKGTVTYENILQWSEGASSFDPYSRRAEFRDVVRKAASM